jgi:hypothetical protein
VPFDGGEALYGLALRLEETTRPLCLGDGKPGIGLNSMPSRQQPTTVCVR